MITNANFFCLASPVATTLIHMTVHNVVLLSYYTACTIDPQLEVAGGCQ